MAEPLSPWVRPGGAAVLRGLKSKPELNGQSVSIVDRDPKSGRWRCKVAPFGEEIKVRVENLAEAQPEAEAEDGPWLRRGVLAAMQGREGWEGTIVRVLRVDDAGGECRCAVKATGEELNVKRANLRPLAGARARPLDTVNERAPSAREPAPAPAPAPRSDWAAAELERRRLAEGFREGFNAGDAVVLQGLRSAPELNGKRGKLVTWNSQSLRWQVEIEGDLGMKSFMPANLVPESGGGGRGKRKNTQAEEAGPGMESKKEDKEANVTEEAKQVEEDNPLEKDGPEEKRARLD